MGLLIGDSGHLGDEGALRQALFNDSEGVEELVVYDGVVHAHAALVRRADDRPGPSADSEDLDRAALYGQSLAVPGHEFREPVDLGGLGGDGFERRIREDL